MIKAAAAFNPIKLPNTHKGRKAANGIKNTGIHNKERLLHKQKKKDVVSPPKRVQ